MSDDDQLVMVVGPSLLVPPWRVGKEEPKVSDEVVPVTKKIVERCRYVGAISWHEEHGALVVFLDPETGVGYAQKG